MGRITVMDGHAQPPLLLFKLLLLLLLLPGSLPLLTTYCNHAGAAGQVTRHQCSGRNLTRVTLPSQMHQAEGCSGKVKHGWG